MCVSFKKNTNMNHNLCIYLLLRLGHILNFNCRNSLISSVNTLLYFKIMRVCIFIFFSFHTKHISYSSLIYPDPYYQPPDVYLHIKQNDCLYSQTIKLKEIIYNLSINFPNENK